MSSPLPPDPYNTLGLPKDAPLATIRSTYKKLVLTCHPDKVTDEKAKAQKREQFDQVQQAYEILSDESKRKRYDDKARLFELRAERFNSPEYILKLSVFPPRSTPTATYEDRGNAIYEERVPRQRSPDEDYSPRYEDVHRLPRRYTERADYGSSRRRSGQAPEEARRSRGREHDYDEEATILREKENERKTREQATHAERKKRRDRERRQDTETKRSYNRPEVISDSESDYDARRERRYEPEPRRKYENSRYKAKPSNYADSESENDLESKHWHSAMSHIQKKEARPTIYRYVTKDNLVPPVPPPPPPAPSQRYRDEVVDTPRHSSARSRSSRDESRQKSSRDERRPSAIDISEARTGRPSLATFTSEPGNIRLPTSDRHMPLRSATMETRSKSTKVPGVVRSATSPLANMVPPRHHSDTDRIKSAKMKTDMYDSPSAGSRSPSPDDQKPVKYRVYKTVDDPRSARVIPVEPEPSFRSARDISPHGKRPSVSNRGSSSARGTPSRSTSYAPEHPVPPRPSVNRSETHHESHRSPLTSSSGSKRLPYEVLYSPRISTKDAIYSPLPKTPVSPYYDKDRDHHVYESRSRPHVSRREPYRHKEAVH